MKQRTILMEGYYGKGNFGDDVLMHVTYHLLHRIAPEASIVVIIGDEQQNYVHSLLPDAIIVAPDRHAVFDLIVHGGGGVFFDFAKYGMLRQLGERVLQTLGFPFFVTLEKFVRALLAMPRHTATKRIGMGIGMGTFTPGSPRMLRSLPILAEMDALWLRDPQSMRVLERFDSVLHAEKIQGSDIAFLTDHWMPNPLPPRVAAAKPRLGVILRDWPSLSLSMLQEALQRLAKVYDITGFIFDAQSDTQMRELLTSYTTHTWYPDHITIQDYAALIAAQDVLLTSRAHGAICGACLGVPSVIVAIEPKMQQVHAMLPQSTLLVDTQDGASWDAALLRARTIAPALIAADVQVNRVSSHAALDAMKRWLI